MVKYSSNEAARQLGLSPSGLSKHIRLEKISAPEGVKTGGKTVYSWSEEDIERARKLLPKIKNGRKTRYQKKKNKPQAKKSVPNKKKN